MSISSCCLKGFEWEGKPSGRTETFSNQNTYITGTNTDNAILIVADLFGWDFPNVRLLADHYAKEANVTVYIPDFFHDGSLPNDSIVDDQWKKLDIAGFMTRHSREIREPEIFEFARTLKSQYKKVGAIGYCYGGWAVFRLAAQEHQPPLVDFITAAHPSFAKKGDIDGIAVPVQILAPEHDAVFTAELKRHAFDTIMKKGVPFDYLHLPGVEHGCLVRGDERIGGDREAMVRGKDAFVGWIKSHTN